MEQVDKVLLLIWLLIGILIISCIDNQTNRWRGTGATATWTEDYKDKALACLTANVYMESRSEPLVGQIAVAQVVMNRAKHKVENVCKVIMARKQFSWTIDGKIRIKNQVAFKRAAWVASKVLNGGLYDRSNGADHYHADYVNPKWAKASCMVHKVSIGKHIFYKCSNGFYKAE